MRTLKVFDYKHIVEETNMANPCIIVRTQSPLDCFVTEETDTSKGKLIRIVNDIGIFFNQQRLAQLNPQILDQLVGAARKADTGLQLTDEQLVENLKSRYIQSNADVWNWAHYIQTHIDDTVKSIKDAYEAKKAAEAAEAAAAAAAAAPPTETVNE